MNVLATLFLIVNAVAFLALPRRWALLPLLLGACYMTAAQQIAIGPFHFTVLRLLILVGAVRLLMENEPLPGGLKMLDRIILFWGAWLLVSSLFHKPFAEALVFRLGAVYNALGFYFLIRFCCRSKDDLVQLIKITAFILLPVALEMVSERLSGQNFFSLFGGVPLEPQMRGEAFRAQGPFGHAILAGTVGAVCMPLIIGIWRVQNLAAKMGLAACLAMVITSDSSGPLMSLACGAFALGLWRWRLHIRQLLMLAAFTYFLLGFATSRPVYYALLNRLDLTGSSTGWHRAELISQSIDHLKEWWFAGTDYTRHWMPYGVSASENHSDITNHYLFYGVWGGLPLMLLFMAALWIAFRYIGQSLRAAERRSFDERFLIWSLGASLFVHAITCISVAYFEQSVMFLFLNLAAIGSLHASDRGEQHYVSSIKYRLDMPTLIMAKWKSSDPTKQSDGLFSNAN